MAETVTLRAAHPMPAMPLLLSANACLQLLDLLTTHLALAAGGAEANPISRAIIEGPGWGAYAALKAMVAAAFLALWPVTRWLTGAEARFALVSMAAFTAMMGVVVLNNVLVTM